VIATSSRISYVGSSPMTWLGLGSGSESAVSGQWGRVRIRVRAKARVRVGAVRVRVGVRVGVRSSPMTTRVPPRSCESSSISASSPAHGGISLDYS
jgi:hypothetical protein